MYSFDSDDSDADNEYFDNHLHKDDYLNNRNKLYEKDTINKFLLIDTQCMRKDNLNTSNFKYDLSNSSDTNTISLNNEQYIIGFELIRANISNQINNINSTNNKIIYRINGSDTDIQLELDIGKYTYSNASDSFTNGIYSYLSEDITYSVNASDQLSILYNSIKHEYTITNINGISIEIKWGNDNTSKKTAKTFGYRPVTSEANPSHISTISPDIDNHFIDIVIDEIPSISCKMNSRSQKVIERIYMNNKSNEMYMYEIELSDTNYFYPMSLNKLSIKIYDDTGEIYDCNNRDVSFEFKIIILKNLDLIK